MFRQENKVHWYCLGGECMGSRTAEMQLCYCDPQAEGFYTFILVCKGKYFNEMGK